MLESFDDRAGRESGPRFEQCGFWWVEEGASTFSLFFVVDWSLRKDGEFALPVTLLKDARSELLVRARNPGGRRTGRHRGCRV